MSNEEYYVRVVRPDLQLAHMRSWLGADALKLGQELCEQLKWLCAASGGASTLSEERIEAEEVRLRGAEHRFASLTRTIAMLRLLGQDAWPLSLVEAALAVVCGLPVTLPRESLATVSSMAIAGWPAAKRAWIRDEDKQTRVDMEREGLPTFVQCRLAEDAPSGPQAANPPARATPPVSEKKKMQSHKVAPFALVYAPQNFTYDLTAMRADLNVATRPSAGWTPDRAVTQLHEFYKSVKAAIHMPECKSPPGTQMVTTEMCANLLALVEVALFHFYAAYEIKE